MFTKIEGLARGLALMGYIKIGRKGELKRSANNAEFRQPKKLDHFEIVTREVDGSDNFVSDSEMMKILGPKPTELEVMFQYDDVELNFPHFLAAYQGSKLFCRGNGQLAVRNNQKIECNPITCPIYQKKEVGNKIQCKPQGKLYCILPQKNMVGGVYAFKTTSWESIRNIVTSLETIYSTTGGIVSGIPLKLKLIPTRDQTPNGSTTNYKVAVIYTGNAQNLRAAAIQEYNLRAVSTIDRKVLADQRRRDLEKETETPEEATETVMEFYPVAAGAESTSQNGSARPKQPGEVKTVTVSATVSRKEEKRKTDVVPSQIDMKEASNGTAPVQQQTAPPAEPARQTQVVMQDAAQEEPVSEETVIYLSGNTEMDINGLFDKLKIKEGARRPQMVLHNDSLGELLKKLVKMAKEGGIEVVENHPVLELQ